MAFIFFKRQGLQAGRQGLPMATPSCRIVLGASVGVLLLPVPAARGNRFCSSVVVVCFVVLCLASARPFVLL